jgi:hypothetical protein
VPPPASAEAAVERALVLLKRLTMAGVAGLPPDRLPALLGQIFGRPAAPRPRSFRHRQLAQRYRARQDARQKQVVVEEDGPALLHSLRGQLVESALQQRELVLKANSLPVYRPRHRADHASSRSFYRAPPEPALPAAARHRLQEELRTALREQLGQIAIEPLDVEGMEESDMDKLRKSLELQLRSLY